MNQKTENTLLPLPLDILNLIFIHLYNQNEVESLHLLKRVSLSFKKIILQLISSLTDQQRLEYENVLREYKKPFVSPALLTSKDKKNSSAVWITKQHREWDYLNQLFLYARRQKIKLFEFYLLEYKRKTQEENIYKLLVTTFNYSGESLYNSLNVEHRRKVLKDFCQKELAKNNDTRVTKAIKFGSLEEVREAINENFCKDTDNYFEENHKLLKLIVQYGRTDLFLPVLTSLNLTLEHCIDQTTCLGKELFKEAVASGTFPLFLNALQPYFDEADYRTDLLFFSAIEKNDFKTVKELYELYRKKNKSPSVLVERYFRAPYYFAIKAGHPKIAELLFETRLQCEKSLRTAINSNNPDMVRFILQKNVDILKELGCYAGYIFEVNKAVMYAPCSLEIKKLLWLGISRQILLKRNRSEFDKELLKLATEHVAYKTKSQPLFWYRANKSLKKIDKLLNPHYKPYSNNRECLREILQPVSGILRMSASLLLALSYSVCTIVFIPILLVCYPLFALIMGGSEAWIQSKSLISLCAYICFFGINHMVIGVVELLATPLLLYKIPASIMASFKMGWLQTPVERTHAIQRLTHEAKTELKEFHQNLDKIQESYQKIQKIFIAVERIDQKHDCKTLKGKTTLLNSSEYQQKLKACVSAMSSILFMPPQENYQIAAKVKENIPAIEGYLNMMSCSGQ